MLLKRGNPFFLEETVRTLVETGALAGERGLPADAAGGGPAGPVQTILAARIDRLSPGGAAPAGSLGHRQGRPVRDPGGGLEQPEEAVRRGLAHLQEAEFLYETRLFPDLEYTFKYALTHEVTYGSLLGDRRRQLHAQIVAAIERLSPDRLSEYVERLAHHALRGYRWDRAVRYNRQPGTRALDGSASAAREALAAFEQAGAALRELPESRGRAEQQIDLAFDERNALLPLGEFERLGDVLGEALAQAEGLGDQRRLGWALGYLAAIYSFLGEHGRAIEAADRARAIGDLGLRVAATYYLGVALRVAGDLRRAAEAMRAAIVLVESARPRERFGLAGLPETWRWRWRRRGCSPRLSPQERRASESPTPPTIDSASSSLS